MATNETSLPENAIGLKTALMDLVIRHGRIKARGEKRILSARTLEWREKNLFLIFSQLKEMGYRLSSPYGLKERHIRALMQRWESEELSASTLQNRLSLLRTFSEWINKPGMVKTGKQYVENPQVLKRKTYAERDKSWTAVGVDPKALIGVVSASDRYVGMQLQLMLAFGLRREEAVMLKPHIADHGWCIVVRDGTKGGRERMVDITNDGQRAVLDAAKAMVRLKNGYVGHPDKTLKQSLRRFLYVLESHGITQKEMGITSHGLRHQRLNDLYEEVAGEPSPVRSYGHGAQSVSGADPDRVELARAKVSAAAGHARLSISSAYTGSARQANKSALDRIAGEHLWKRLFDLATCPERTAAENAEYAALKSRLNVDRDSVARWEALRTQPAVS